MCSGLVIGCSTYGQEFVGVWWLSDRVQDLRARVCGCRTGERIGGGVVVA